MLQSKVLGDHSLRGSAPKCYAIPYPSGHGTCLQGRDVLPPVNEPVEPLRLVYFGDRLSYGFPLRKSGIEVLFCERPTGSNMPRLRNLCLRALVFAIASVCVGQSNLDQAQQDKVSMHNAMMKGDTGTMKVLLDKGSVKLDGWVGFGNIQTWVEDACFAGSPAAMELLLQRGADTLRLDTVRLGKDGQPSNAQGWQQANALAWCFGGGSVTFISSDGSSKAAPEHDVLRGDADSVELFGIFIKYFEQQVKKTADPSKTLNEQVAMAGGTGKLIALALKNHYDDVCLEKVTWVVNSGQDVADFWRLNKWPDFLAAVSKSNPTCATYLRNELQKREGLPPKQ